MTEHEPSISQSAADGRALVAFVVCERIHMVAATTVATKPEVIPSKQCRTLPGSPVILCGEKWAQWLVLCRCIFKPQNKFRRTSLPLLTRHARDTFVELARGERAILWLQIVQQSQCRRLPETMRGNNHTPHRCLLSPRHTFEP